MQTLTNFEVWVNTTVELKHMETYGVWVPRNKTELVSDSIYSERYSQTLKSGLRYQSPEIIVSTYDIATRTPIDWPLLLSGHIHLLVVPIKVFLLSLPL